MKDREKVTYNKKYETKKKEIEQRDRNTERDKQIQIQRQKERSIQRENRDK